MTEQMAPALDFGAMRNAIEESAMRISASSA
jgi:hypothetical protein